ncbi:MAG: hypothetical protein WC284_18795 [Candidimonas sp.]
MSGLRENDLKNMVLPIISIDEYHSKLGDDEDVIVIAFFVKDKDPAIDLNRFIEKGPSKIYDVDISRVPNKHGRYLVFVEFPRDDQFSDNLISLIKTIKGLTGIDKWSFKPYKHSNEVDLTADNIKKYIKLPKRVDEFFKHSMAVSVIVENDYLVIEGYGGRSILSEWKFKKVDDIQSEAILMDSDSRWELRHICSILGPYMAANKIGNKVVISSSVDPDMVIIGKLAS